MYHYFLNELILRYVIRTGTIFMKSNDAHISTSEVSGGTGMHHGWLTAIFKASQISSHKEV